MQYLKTETKDNYVIITLDRGKANPMNGGLIIEMRDLIKDLLKDDKIQGVILTGKEHFFSAGLDVIELYDYDTEELKRFWINFHSLIYELAAFNKPLIAAISGHSPAGGCVLALCCDYRIMAQGNYKIGLNEIPVGITLPTIIYNLYANTIGSRLAHQFLMEGKLHSPEEALEAHLIDGIYPYAELLAKAEEKLKLYLNFDPVTWQLSKQNIRKDFVASLKEDFDEVFEVTLEQWWSPATRARMGKIVESLKGS